MKHLTTILAFAILSLQLTAQKAGTIKYNHVVKLEINAPEGIDLGDMMPSEIATKKELVFNNNLSVFQDSKENVSEDIEMSSDDGSFKMIIEQDDTEDILYTDLKAKTTLHQTGFMGKEFLIEEDLERPKWKITDERIKYLGHVCQKATMVQTIPPGPGAKEGETPKERQVVAWFTPEIHCSVGPDSFNQLPGAILMISVDDGKTEIKATEIIFDSPESERLEKPTKGQKVSGEEYEKIMAEKLKEMEEMYGGRNGTIMIRG